MAIIIAKTTVNKIVVATVTFTKLVTATAVVEGK